MGRLLLIDDDRTLIDAYEVALTKAGFKVAKANDGRDALFKIRNERFDLILTDIKMPKLSGIELIESLREQERDWNTICPIIISSGFIDDFVYSKYQNIGRIHFMPKPVSKADLLAKVRSVLNLPNEKPKVDAQFVNLLLLAVAKVIGEMAGVQLSFGAPVLKKAGEASGDISGIVGVVSSKFRGNLSLSFDEQGFLRLVRKFTKIDFKDLGEEVRDSIAQLLSQIFVEAKKELTKQGFDVQTSIPSVVTGKNHCVDHKISSPAVTVLMSNPEFGECKVEICSAAGRAADS